MASEFTFSARVPKGTPPHEAHHENLLVFECAIPMWDVLTSYEAVILRDGERAFDISTYSFGVTRHADGRLWLKFQTWDRTVATIVDHDYTIEAYFHFR